MLRRVENGGDEVRPTPRDAKRTLAGEAVNRMPSRGLVDRQYVFATFEDEARIGDATGKRKQNRDAATMRMRAPRVRVIRSCDYLERADAVAEALASCRWHDDRAFALRFEGNQIHDDSYSTTSGLRIARKRKARAASP